MTEPEAHLKKFQKELSAGTVSLALLAKATEPMYGYLIAYGQAIAGTQRGAVVSNQIEGKKRTPPSGGVLVVYGLNFSGCILR